MEEEERRLEAKGNVFVAKSRAWDARERAMDRVLAGMADVKFDADGAAVNDEAAGEAGGDADDEPKSVAKAPAEVKAPAKDAEDRVPGHGGASGHDLALGLTQRSAVGAGPRRA